MMNLTITESPVVGGGACLPSSPSTTGDFSIVRHRSYKNVTFAILKGSDGLVGVINGWASPVTHPDGRPFKHAQSLICTCKTVIRWHLKFGGWRLPR